MPSKPLSLCFTGCACVLNCGVWYIIYLPILKKLGEDKLTLVNQTAPYSKRLGLSRNQNFMPKFSLTFWRSSRTLSKQWFAEKQKSHLTEVSLSFCKLSQRSYHLKFNFNFNVKILHPVNLMPCNYCFTFSAEKLFEPCLSCLSMVLQLV